MQNKIITSWRESKVAVFAPSDRYPDSDLMIASVAFKDCKIENYSNTRLWDEAKRRLRELQTTTQPFALCPMAGWATSMFAVTQQTLSPSTWFAKPTYATACPKES